MIEIFIKGSVTNVRISQINESVSRAERGFPTYERAAVKGLQKRRFFTCQGRVVFDRPVLTFNINPPPSHAQYGSKSEKDSLYFQIRSRVINI